MKSFKNLPKDKGEFLQKEFSLNAFEELRILNKFSDFIYIQLQSGKAEIFG